MRRVCDNGIYLIYNFHKKKNGNTVGEGWGWWGIRLSCAFNTRNVTSEVFSLCREGIYCAR